MAAEVRTMEPRVLLTATAADDAVWDAVEAFPASDARGVSYLNLSDYTPLTMNDTALRQTLDAAPDEGAFNFSIDTNTLTLVDPDGNLERFAIYETAIMAPELAAQFPNIKTYAGQGIDDPTAVVQLDLTPQGFHAQVLSEHGRWYIDPYYHLNDDFYASYYAADAIASTETRAALQADLAPVTDIDRPATAPAANTSSTASAEVVARSGTQLRTYRTAVAASGEYTAFHGGTVNLGQAAIVTAVNRVSGIYENELSIRLQLIGNNSSLVYTNPATDPYTNTNANALLTENQSNLDTVIGTANYDIGHVFTTGGGGLAGLGVVGSSSQKAWGETGLSTPTGDAFYVDYVAHEIGHQFGANHTFNVPDPNRNASTAYEPGSGSTIMAYAGLFGVDDLQGNSDPYFHSISFDEIIAYVDTSIPAVGTRTNTGNNVPTVNAGSDFTIPANTPFKLTAIGADADGTGALTYNWEERDLGPEQTLAAAQNTTSPIFRSFTPTSDPSRTFLRLPDLINNTTTKGEKLPSLTRDLNFRATVRDNRAGGGGVNTDDMVVHVVNTGAAFAVTSPTTAVTWAGGSNQTVTWNVAGTTANGINVANVRILLSTDGGNTFGTVISASTPNDGSQSIVVPNTATTQARIKVEAIGNVFFDFSNVNFTITGGSNQTPVMNNQTFYVNEGSANGTVVGTIIATDPDAGQMLSFFPFFESNPGVFDVNLGTGQITVANSSALTAGLTALIGVDVTDNGTPPLSAAADMTIIVNDVPTIGGAAANQAMNDTQTRQVFNTLTVADTDTQAMTSVVRINNGVVRGDFTAGTTTGWTRTLSGNDIQYSRTFGPAANIGSVVQTAVRALIFDPRENAIKPGTTETTTFNVTVADGVASPVLNTATSVIVTSLNNAPTIGGASASVTVNDNATVNPFSPLTVTDADNQEMLAKVTILNGTVRGDFTNGVSAGWTKTVLGNNINYVRYFSPGLNIGSTVQAAFRALIFQPRSNVINPGTTELTDFLVSVSDGVAAAVSNQGTRVTTTSVNNAPTIGGAVAGQTMNDNTTKAVFNTLTVTDPDTQDMFARVTIPNGINRGDFTVASRAGWTRTVTGNNIVYTRFFGAVSNIGVTVQTAIRALVFQPRNNVPISTTETTGFTVFVNDGLANVTNSTTTVITTGVAPRPDADLVVPPLILDSDTTTVVLPTAKKAAANSLARLLKKTK